MDKLNINLESEEKLWVAVERQIPRLLLETTYDDDDDDAIPPPNKDLTNADENGMTNVVTVDNYHLTFRRKGQKAVNVGNADSIGRRIHSGVRSFNVDELFCQVERISYFQGNQETIRRLAIKRSAIDQKRAKAEEISSRMVGQFKNLLDEDVRNEAYVVCSLDEDTMQELISCFLLNRGEGEDYRPPWFWYWVTILAEQAATTVTLVICARLVDPIGAVAMVLGLLASIFVIGSAEKQRRMWFQRVKCWRGKIDMYNGIIPFCDLEVYNSMVLAVPAHFAVVLCMIIFLLICSGKLVGPMLSISNTLSVMIRIFGLCGYGQVTKDKVRILWKEDGMDEKEQVLSDMLKRAATETTARLQGGIVQVPCWASTAARDLFDLLGVHAPCSTQQAVKLRGRCIKFGGLYWHGRSSNHYKNPVTTELQ